MTGQQALDAAISEVERLRKSLKKSKPRQVRTAEEKSLIKATALAWFNNNRNALVESLSVEALQPIDQVHRELLAAADRGTLRGQYIVALKGLHGLLVDLRSREIVELSSRGEATSDGPPDFGALIGDETMKRILENRWIECVKCIRADAPLAATVMMGGFLEAILLARINSEPDKGVVFKAKSAPRDREGKTLPLRDWGLRTYIDVSHELRWITQSARDVGEVLRDFRNYIHPYKEFQHGARLAKADAELFWEISKSITRQLLTAG